MKTLKLRWMMAIGLIVFAINAAFAADRLTEPSGASARFERERASMDKTRYYGYLTGNMNAYEVYKIHISWLPYFGNAEMFFAPNKEGADKYRSEIIRDEYKVKLLRGEVKTFSEKKDLKATKSAKRKLAKAKFDLFRDQVHFLVDMAALKQDHLMVLASYREELAADQADLRKAKNDLKKATSANNSIGIKRENKIISMKEKEIRDDKIQINSQKAAIRLEMKAAMAVLKFK